MTWYAALRFLSASRVPSLKRCGLVCMSVSRPCKVAGLSVCPCQHRPRDDLVRCGFSVDDRIRCGSIWAWPVRSFNGFFLFDDLVRCSVVSALPAPSFKRCDLVCVSSWGPSQHVNSFCARAINCRSMTGQASRDPTLAFSALILDATHASWY